MRMFAHSPAVHIAPLIPHLTPNTELLELATAATPFANARLLELSTLAAGSSNLPHLIPIPVATIFLRLPPINHQRECHSDTTRRSYKSVRLSPRIGAYSIVYFESYAEVCRSWHRNSSFCFRPPPNQHQRHGNSARKIHLAFPQAQLHLPQQR
ncbi:hypothetical protein BDD12DRAFT_536967 [Trichophaea hybrida]|nr:hypothetical protein BDD12DRAFT_536967 [Trichophaea hybrida]